VVLCFTADVSFLLFFVSPQDRVLSADRHETLPHDRKLLQFYNPGIKIQGPSPKNFVDQKCAKLVVILDQDNVILQRTIRNG